MFRPDRHLSSSGELHDSLPESRGQGHLSFGSGRRFVARLIGTRPVNVNHILSICVGKDVANQSLFIALASMLWAFNIEKAVDADGKPINPPHGDLDVIDDGVVVYV